MELDINTLLKGKATKIKGKEYYSTAAYVEPFLERMSKYTDDFRIQAIMSDQISLTPDGEVNLEDAIYNRVWIQAVMPDNSLFENHDRVIGMVYGLDTRKPIVKLYQGGLNRACTNLCIFSPSFLNVQELEAETAINYKPIEHLMKQTDDLNVRLNKMVNTEVPYDEKLINENLGLWIRNSLSLSQNNQYGKVKLATSSAIDAYKLLYEKEDSPYFVGEGNTTDQFNIYNAWTQVITDDKKDIINKCEKTLLVSNIIGV